MVVETAWLMSSAMLMPLERMRVGMSSESASQTQTPGPTAKNAMKRKQANGREPAVVFVGHGRDERVFNFQRSRSRGVKVGKWI